jgi:hypothetical protein
VIKPSPKTKSESSKSPGNNDSLVALGWLFDIKNWTISVPRNNRFKALHTFTSINTNLPVPLKTLQAIASLAQRYCLVYPQLSLFLGPLYRTCYPTHICLKRLRQFTPEAKIAVRVWIAHLTLSEIQHAKGLKTGRDLDSFAEPVSHDLAIEFDGCPDGTGARLLHYPRGVERYDKDLHKIVTKDVICLRDSGLLSGFKFAKDSRGNLLDKKWQNHSETLGLCGGCLLGASAGFRGTCFYLRGDSITVLSWASKNRFNSPHALSAALLLKAIMSRFDYSFLKETEFIKSDVNRITDARSRGKDPSNLVNYIPTPPDLARFQDSNGCIYGAPAAATKKLFALADPIVFRDNKIMDSEHLLLTHMKSIEDALTEWESALATLR